MPGWTTFRHSRFGFTLRIPDDWAVDETANYVRFHKGASSVPAGVPEVDVFLGVEPLHREFPGGYLAGEPSASGVRYSEREERDIGGLAVVRANFRSAGPVPNWGVEYAIRKNDTVLHIYISQPGPEIAARFDDVVRSLEW